MDAKFDRRFQSFRNSLDALAEARHRDLSDSFVLSGTSAKFSRFYVSHLRQILFRIMHGWICLR